MKKRILSFRNINFFEIDYNHSIKLLKKKGGYIVFPAASSLVTIYKNLKYHEALQKSTIALFDSGYFCILLIILKFKYFSKFSGYKFISYFLNDSSFKKKKILLLNSSKTSSEINYLFLKSKKFNLIKNYICPKYSAENINDKNLVNVVKKYKPEVIISNIGGGIQEILALNIKKNCKKKIKIFCTGAALSFFTGEQAYIGAFFDKLYLGWLKRLIFDPRQYINRILNSLPLALIVFKTKINISYY